MNFNKKTLATSLVAGAILLVPSVSYADSTPAPVSTNAPMTTNVPTPSTSSPAVAPAHTGRPDAATKAARKAAREAYKAAMDKWKMDNKAAFAANKTARDAYHAAQMKNKDAYKAADEAFKMSIMNAEATFKTAVKAPGVTVDAKNAAATALKAAVDTARSVRDAAKAAIVVPMLPEKPVLTPKPVAPAK